MAPPLALVRSRICATSVVNACVDDAKPATVFDWRGPVCFFLTVEKEEAAQKATRKSQGNTQKRITLASVQLAGTRVILFFVAVLAVSRILRILERRQFPSACGPGAGALPLYPTRASAALDPARALGP